MLEIGMSAGTLLGSVVASGPLLFWCGKGEVEENIHWENIGRENIGQIQLKGEGFACKGLQMVDAFMKLLVEPELIKMKPKNHVKCL